MNLKQLHIIKQGLIILAFFNITNSLAQEYQNRSFEFHLEGFVKLIPDSTFKLVIDIPSFDTIAHNIRFVVSDSLSILSDHQYSVDSLQSDNSGDCWKENDFIHIRVPDYDPFKRNHYLLEVLDINNQLLYQTEKEF